MKNPQRSNLFQKKLFQLVVKCCITLIFAVTTVASLILLVSFSLLPALSIGLLVFVIIFTVLTYKPAPQGISFQVPYCHFAAKFKGQQLISLSAGIDEVHFSPEQGEYIKLFDWREHWHSMTIPCITADQVKLNLHIKFCWQYALPPIPLPDNFDPNSLPQYLFQASQQFNPQQPIPQPEQPIKSIDAIKICSQVLIMRYVAIRDTKRALQDMHRQSLTATLMPWLHQEGWRHGLAIQKVVFISAKQIHSVPHIAAMAEAEAYKLRHLSPAVREAGQSATDYILKSQSFWDAQKKSAVSENEDGPAD